MNSENAAGSITMSNMHLFISSNDTMIEIGQTTKVGKNGDLASERLFSL